jgi:hypothetical protein
LNQFNGIKIHSKYTRDELSKWTMKCYFGFTLLCFYPNATTQGVLRDEYFRSNKAMMPNSKTKKPFCGSSILPTSRCDEYKTKR